MKRAEKGAFVKKNARNAFICEAQSLAEETAISLESAHANRHYVRVANTSAIYRYSSVHDPRKTQTGD